MFEVPLLRDSRISVQKLRLVGAQDRANLHGIPCVEFPLLAFGMRILRGVKSAPSSERISRSRNPMVS